jgi:hypothetical protein
MAFQDHLSKQDTYQFLTSAEAIIFGENIRTHLKNWLKRWKGFISKNETRFIKQALFNPTTDPISTFYLLMKVHKTPLAT